MHELRALSDLKPAPYNPRAIDDAALKALTSSLDLFGDISGIVWNRRSGHLVCGHQRIRALREKYGDSLSLCDGCLCAGDKRFPVRVVDWDEAIEKAANIAANSELLMGEFTAGAKSLIEDLSAELDGAELVKALRFDELALEVADSIPEPGDGGGTEAVDRKSLLPEHLRDIPIRDFILSHKKIFLGMSGGKDSTLLAIWARDNLPEMPPSREWMKAVQFLALASKSERYASQYLARDLQRIAGLPPKVSGDGGT